MAGVPPAQVNPPVGVAHKLLDVDTGDAQLGQAQLTRLQMALGLKKELKDGVINNLSRGEDLPSLDDTKPTGYPRKGDVAVVSVHLEVQRLSGNISSAYLACGRILLAHLAGTAPTQFLDQTQFLSIAHESTDSLQLETSLGQLRRTVANTFEPVCTDDKGSGYEPSNARFHAHAQHNICPHRRDIILLLANKEEDLLNLKDLGFDPEQHLHVVDILDLRQIYRAYQMRSVGCVLGVEQINSLQNGVLDTTQEIWRQLSPSTGAGCSAAKATVEAALSMAIKDATSPRSLRTREQVDGGDFPGPLRKLDTPEDVKAFLLEYGIAMKGPSSKKELEIAIKHVKMQPEAMTNIAATNRARTYNYMYLLTGESAAKVQETASPGGRSAKVKALIELAKAETRSSTPSSAAVPHPLWMNQAVPSTHMGTIRGYQKAGRDISRSLVTFIESKKDKWTKFERDEFARQCSYIWQPHTERGVSSHYPELEFASTFPKIAGKAEQCGWTMNDEVATWFLDAIAGRRKLRDWHDRLPEADSRHKVNKQHEHFLQELIKVVGILFGHPDHRQ